MADTAPAPRPLHEEVAALRQQVAALQAALTAQQHDAQALRKAREASPKNRRNFVR